jgi:hypothetical protein
MIVAARYGHGGQQTPAYSAFPEAMRQRNGTATRQATSHPLPQRDSEIGPSWRYAKLVQAPGSHSIGGIMRELAPAPRTTRPWKRLSMQVQKPNFHRLSAAAADEALAGPDGARSATEANSGGLRTGARNAEERARSARIRVNDQIIPPGRHTSSSKSFLDDVDSVAKNSTTSSREVRDQV